MKFDRVQLQAPAASLAALDDFYAGRLGLVPQETAWMVGETKLVFGPGPELPSHDGVWKMQSFTSLHALSAQPSR